MYALVLFFTITNFRYFLKQKHQLNAFVLLYMIQHLCAINCASFFLYLMQVKLLSIWTVAVFMAFAISNLN